MVPRAGDRVDGASGVVHNSERMATVIAIDDVPSFPSRSDLARAYCETRHALCNKFRIPVGFQHDKIYLMLSRHRNSCVVCKARAVFVCGLGVQF